MNGRVIAALIGVFLVGAVLGVVVGRAIGDSDDSAGERAPTEEECVEARDVVDAANEDLASLSGSDATQDAGYFAAVIVELRSINFAMDEAPECFTVPERAQAAGLLAGIQLLGASAPAPAGPGEEPIIPDIDESAPQTDPPTDPPSTDPATTEAP